MTDQDETEMHWISDRAGVGVFEDDVVGGYTMYIDAQGKAVEFGIPEQLYDDIRKNFDHLDMERR